MAKEVTFTTTHPGAVRNPETGLTELGASYYVGGVSAALDTLCQHLTLQRGRAGEAYLAGDMAAAEEARDRVVRLRALEVELAEAAHALACRMCASLASIVGGEGGE